MAEKEVNIKEKIDFFEYNGKIYKYYCARENMETEPQPVRYTKEIAGRLGFECEVFYHESSGRTTEDAERATGVDTDHIIKCLLLKSKKDEYVGAIVRGSDRLNFKEIEAVTGYKGLRMAQESDIREQLGFDIGGVPAVIFREKGIQTFVDQHVLDMDYVVGSGGTPHHGMRFEPSQLTDRLSYTAKNIIQ